mgnify:CR=1 FL=1
MELTLRLHFRFVKTGWLYCLNPSCDGTDSQTIPLYGIQTNPTVLILLVMELTLRPVYIMKSIVERINVLILLVMELTLRLLRILYVIAMTCLNPSCDGTDSQTYSDDAAPSESQLSLNPSCDGTDSQTIIR